MKLSLSRSMNRTIVARVGDDTEASGSDQSPPLPIRTGPETATYQVGALASGSYFFHCDVHPTMTGTLTVK